MSHRSTPLRSRISSGPLACCDSICLRPPRAFPPRGRAFHPIPHPPPSPPNTSRRPPLRPNHPPPPTALPRHPEKGSGVARVDQARLGGGGIAPPSPHPRPPKRKRLPPPPPLPSCHLPPPPGRGARPPPPLPPRHAPRGPHQSFLSLRLILFHQGTVPPTRGIVSRCRHCWVQLSANGLQLDQLTH